MKDESEELIWECKEVAATCISFNLRRTMRTVNQHYAEAVGSTGINPTQFSLLVACRLAEPAPLSVLAAAISMDRTTLARNLEPLQGAALVTVEPGSDRRVKIVQLTDLGRAKIAECYGFWADAHATIVSRFGGDRLARLVSELHSLEDALKT